MASIDKKGKYTVYQYPPDLGGPRYPHYVLFFSNVNPQSSQAATAATVDDGGKSKRTQGTSAAGKARGMMGNEFKRTDQAIALYMPPQVKASYNMSYEESDANVIGNTLLGAGEKLKEGNVLGALTGVVKSEVRWLGSKATNLAMGGDDKAVMGGITGKIDNPRVEALFKSTQLRTHQFSWTFYPKDEDESDTIRDIIHSFKMNMHPELVTQASGNNSIGDLEGSYLAVPNQYDIEFHGPEAVETEMTMIHKIATCVLETLDVDYTAAGQWLAYTGTSNPFCISLTLQFKEIEPLTRQMIKDGF